MWLSLLVVHCGIVAGLEVTRTFAFTGGHATCSAADCVAIGGVYHNGPFACSGPNGHLNLSNPMVLPDPLPHVDGQVNVLHQVVVSLVGRFHCDPGVSPPSTMVLLNGILVTWDSLPDTPDGCSCPRCVVTWTRNSTVYPKGFPSYVYGGDNELHLSLTNRTASLCAMELRLTLNYTQHPLDPCDMSSSNFYSTDRVLSCIHTVPHDPVVGNATIQNLLKALELYPFLDISRQPPPPFEAVDLKEELQRLLTLVFPTDIDFHITIMGIWRRLRDFHTVYTPPQCYDFQAWQVLPLVAYTDETGTGVRIEVVSAHAMASVNCDPGSHTHQYCSLVQYYTDELGIDLEVYVNATVVSIDGQPAVEMLEHFAKVDVGWSKDPGTRMWLSQTQYGPLGAIVPGAFQWRRWDRTDLPTRSNVTYDIQFPNGTRSVVEFPWMFQNTNSFKSTPDFIKFCSLLQPDDNEPHNSARSLYRPQQSPRMVEPPPGYVEVVNDPLAQFYWRPTEHGNELVMVIPTFDMFTASSLLTSVAKGFSVGAELNATHLIVDLTGNLGGNLCAARSLLNVTGLLEGADTLRTDLPSSPLAREMASNAVTHGIGDTYWSPNTYEDTKTGLPYTDDGWMIPGVPRVRGGLHRNYSQLVRLAKCKPSNVHIPDRGWIRRAKVAVVTHGLCGSSCALFADHVKLYSHGTTFAISIRPNVPQMYTSFPGLQVLGEGQLVGAADQLAPGSPFAPHSVHGSYRMCYREVYGPQLDVPLEYTFQRADHQIPSTRLFSQSFGMYWVNVSAALAMQQPTL